MFGEGFLLDLAIRMPAILLALTVHEFLHGYVAYRCGDPTAKDLGRLTLNPLAHLDLMGTICLIFAPIGWAKPVPINPNYFRHPRRDDILVSLAGVTGNLVLGVIFCTILRYMLLFNLVPEGQLGGGLLLFVMASCVINFGLMIFNLLPIAPLDGHHVVRELLPYPANERFMEFSRYGPILLLALVLLNRGAGLNLFFKPLGPLVNLFAGDQGFALMRQFGLV